MAAKSTVNRSTIDTANYMNIALMVLSARFSKTKIIRWHEVSKPWLAGIGAVWSGVVVAYAIDYDAGFTCIFTLSVLHLLLEFPLDIRPLIGIGTEFRMRTVFHKAELLSS